MDDYGRKLIEQGAREEREDIIRRLSGWLNNPKDARTVNEVIESIKSRGEKKPVKIAHILGNFEADWVGKLNEIIDTVNALTEKKA